MSKKEKVKKYSKRELLRSVRYADMQDLLAVLLEDTIDYSFEEVEKILKGADDIG